MEEDIKLKFFKSDTNSILPLPYADMGVKAGFPSPAQDYLTDYSDLNKEIIKNPDTTFYARVEGKSMIDAGIFDGDLIVVDKSLEVQNGNLVVAFINGEFTLKQYKTDPKGNCAWLVPANKEFPPIKVTPYDNFMVWGVVTYCIKKFS